MKLIFLMCGLIAAQLANAQKGMEGLIKAERSFAATSVGQSTKDAFLGYLDAEGVVFDQEGKAINGIEFWQKREKRPAKLTWRPEYAEIAASGDFGYTTGSWQMFLNAKMDTAVGQGHYTTLWRINQKENGDF